MRFKSPYFLFSALAISCSSDKNLGVFNAEPQASISSHSDGDSVYEAVAVTFKAALSDPNNSNDDLTASWSTGGVELCPSTPPDANGD